jgi:hypothetical protein
LNFTTSPVVPESLIRMPAPVFPAMMFRSAATVLLPIVSFAAPPRTAEGRFAGGSRADVVSLDHVVGRPALGDLDAAGAIAGVDVAGAGYGAADRVAGGGEVDQDSEIIGQLNEPRNVGARPTLATFVAGRPNSSRSACRATRNVRQKCWACRQRTTNNSQQDNRQLTTAI